MTDLLARVRCRGQSVRGLVRTNLAYIEQEHERGVNFATLRSRLGITKVSPEVFRDALYRARRRSERRQAVRQRSVPSAEPIESADEATYTDQQESRPRVIPMIRASANQRATVDPRNIPRDFRELVRTTADSEIL